MKQSEEGIGFICAGSDLILSTSGTDYEYKTMQGPFNYYYCKNCDHLGQFPIPDIKTVSLMYDKNYYTINSRSPLFLKGFIYKKKILSDVTRILRIEGIDEDSCILDIGCGDGVRLLELREILGEDAQLTGLDLAFSDQAKKNFLKANVSLEQCNIETDNINVPDNSLDLVIMSQIIEHLVDPRKAIMKIIPKLAVGGRILIETPNVGGMDHTIFKQRYWGGYHIPRHLQIFSHRSLGKLIQESGLSIDQRKFLPSPGFWIISIRNALKLNSIGKGHSMFEVINFSNLLFVGIFTLIDKIRLIAGLKTSNQQLIAIKSE